MVCDARNILYAGIGAAVVTCEKTTEIIDLLVRKGKVTVDEGMELSKELKREIKKSTADVRDKAVEAFDSMKPLTREDLEQILSGLNYADKSDILELKRRIESIEMKIN